MVPDLCMGPWSTLVGVDTCSLRSVPGRDAPGARAGGAAGRLRAPCGSCRGRRDGRMVRRVPDMSWKTPVRCHSMISHGPLYRPHVLWVMRDAPLPYDIPSQLQSCFAGPASSAG